jgi:hypothetical protein
MHGGSKWFTFMESKAEDTRCANPNCLRSILFASVLGRRESPLH